MDITEQRLSVDDLRNSLNLVLDEPSVTSNALAISSDLTQKQKPIVIKSKIFYCLNTIEKERKDS